MPTHLQCRRQQLILLSGLLPSKAGVVIRLLQGDVPEAEHEVLEDHLRGEDVLREPDHAAARHGSQRGVLQVLNLHITHHMIPLFVYFNLKLPT